MSSPPDSPVVISNSSALNSGKKTSPSSTTVSTSVIYIVSTSESASLNSPWRIKGEQKQFKELTTGNTVVMGRKSYEEIGHPLPNRMNIVVSNTAYYSGENLLTVHSLQEALDAVKEGNVYISGGYGLFKEDFHSLSVYSCELSLFTVSCGCRSCG